MDVHRILLHLTRLIHFEQGSCDTPHPTLGTMFGVMWAKIYFQRSSDLTKEGGPL